jgi:acyl-CoA synthetase (AMP-forming)/AMP-acid ligase II
MRGYFRRDDLTAQVVSQGWFSTGDRGVIDDRGYLYLKGRVRDEINKSGQKIHPVDVDAVIERFPDTMDVCTFAYADPLHGEDVGVAVVLQPAADDVLNRLQRFTAEHLAAHQMPNRWYVLEHIPRNPRGKVSRTAVADLCKEGPFRTFVKADPRRID